MNDTEKLELPAFFNYKEEGTDDGYESIQDFFLSWTLRCADEKYRGQNSVLHEIGKQTVFFLMHGDNKNDSGYILEQKMSPDFRVTNVKTRRQLKKIDLIAEMEIEENSIKKKYVFNIEDKWYSSIRDGQLEYSKDTIITEYGNKGYEIINLVIFCDEEIIERDSTQKLRCKTNGYKCLTIGDISEYTELKARGKTGNALFDEYWFNS